MLGNLFLGTLAGNLAWKPLPENPAGEALPGSLGNLFLGTLLGNIFLGTFANLAWEPFFETLLGNLFWNLAWACLGTPSWEPGNLAQWDFGCSDLLRDLYYG